MEIYIGFSEAYISCFSVYASCPCTPPPLPTCAHAHTQTHTTSVYNSTHTDTLRHHVLDARRAAARTCSGARPSQPSAADPQAWCLLLRGARSKDTRLSSPPAQAKTCDNNTRDTNTRSSNAGSRHRIHSAPQHSGGRQAAQPGRRAAAIIWRSLAREVHKQPPRPMAPACWPHAVAVASSPPPAAVPF